MGGVEKVIDPHGSVEQLWQEAWREPWAMQVRLVLGDALQLAGDAHGELIAVQLALERLPDDDDTSNNTHELRDALVQRQEQLLKRLKVQLLGRHDPGELTWRAGFIDSAVVHDLSGLSSLIECRGAWLLRCLKYRGFIDDFRDLIRRLDDGRATPLEELRVGSRGESLGCGRRFRIKPLFDALPRLRHLELWSASPDFEASIALRLEHLTIAPALEVSAVLESLGRARCPALKTLAIALIDDELKWPRALLDSSTLGPIERLRLDGPFEPQAVRQLMRSRLAAQVTQLSIRLPSWLRWPAQFEWGDALDKIYQLELVAPHFSATVGRQLERGHSKIRVRQVGAYDAPRQHSTEPP